MSDRERILLEQGFKKGASHCFRNCCHALLLKAEGRSSKDVGLITGMRHISVNHWVKRFKSEGVSCLHNRPGRKTILDAGDRKSLLGQSRSTGSEYKLQKLNGKQIGGKSVSDSTLRRF